MVAVSGVGVGMGVVFIPWVIMICRATPVLRCAFSCAFGHSHVCLWIVPGTLEFRCALVRTERRGAGGRGAYSCLM